MTHVEQCQGNRLDTRVGRPLVAALHAAGAVVVIAFALVLGLTTAFAVPALQALVPGLVGREELPAAVAMSSVTFTLARAVGPAAGALVVEHAGIAAAFALNS